MMDGHDFPDSPANHAMVDYMRALELKRVLTPAHGQALLGQMGYAESVQRASAPVVDREKVAAALRADKSGALRQTMREHAANHSISPVMRGMDDLFELLRGVAALERQKSLSLADSDAVYAAAQEVMSSRLVAVGECQGRC